MVTIRPLNPNSKQEIDLVADQMQKTLVDVMGPEKGTNYYSKSWLKERVKYHIDLADDAVVFVACDDNKVIGQAIVRIELDKDKLKYGYFSTIYIQPKYRQQGVASELVKKIINWCSNKRLPYIVYNTAKNHQKMKSLLLKFDFDEALSSDDMVQFKMEIHRRAEVSDGTD